MTILLDKKRKTFGEDLKFNEFVELLKSFNPLLNFKNPKIINALKDCFDYYCLNDGKINKLTLIKDVIKKIPFIKHSHNSREGLLERGFDEDFISKYKKERSNFCIEYWLKKGYSEKEGKEIISKMQSERSKKAVGKRPIVNKKYIEALGKDCNKFFRERSVWCVEYWLKRGYSKNDAEKKVSEYQTELAKRNASKSKSERRKNSVRCIEHWLEKGYSEKDAKEKVAEMQSTFSLKKCIKKYGETEGLKRWKERQEKWQDSLNKTGFHQLGYSKISQELFSEILKKYPEEEKDFVFYEDKNREYTLKNDNNFYYRYDFCDLNKRKFIEFNGDIYHANPKMFKPSDKPNPFHDQTAEELWKIDEDKKNIAKRNGFEEFVVWEKDYRENKEKVINECLDFLKK